MSKSFCFLRAINVGKRRMAMADLSHSLSESGLVNVETFIASGNFVCDGNCSEDDIEATIEKRFGFFAEAFVRSREEVSSLVEQHAGLAEAAGVHCVQIGLLKLPPDADFKARIQALANPLDLFEFGPREVIWTAFGRVSETPFGKKGITGKSWPASTFRNVSTLEKMLAKWS